MKRNSSNSPIRITASDHLDETLQRLSEVASVEDGRVSWDSEKLDKGSFEIMYSLKFNQRIEDHIKDGAVWHVLNECARSQNFSSKYFSQRLRKYLDDWDKKTPQSLVAIAQINCKNHSRLPKYIKSFNGKIEFRATLKPSDWSILTGGDFKEKDTIGLHDDFVYIITNANASDHRSAIDRAERNMKYGLGILNLINHGYGISKRFGYPNAPIGKFLSASSIFLIDRDKRRIGSYFSDNNYPHRFKSSFSVWQQIDQEDSRISDHYCKFLRKTNFPEKIIQAVILFQEGLEATGIDLALLKFWTGIELLCTREEKEKSDRIIGRASSIFTNPKYVAMRLQYIQDFRNKIVHKRTSGDHAILCAQWGSIILAEIIRFSLFNKHKIRRHDQMLQYMSIPTNKDSVDNLILLCKKRRASLISKQER